MYVLLFQDDYISRTSAQCILVLVSRQFCFSEFRVVHTVLISRRFYSADFRLVYTVLYFIQGDFIRWITILYYILYLFQGDFILQIFDECVLHYTILYRRRFYSVDLPYIIYCTYFKTILFRRNSVTFRRRPCTLPVVPIVRACALLICVLCFVLVIVILRSIPVLVSAKIVTLFYHSLFYYSNQFGVSVRVLVNTYRACVQWTTVPSI